MSSVEAIIQGIVEVAKILQDPVLLMGFLCMGFAALSVYAEKKEKKFLMTEVLGELTDQIDVLADEVKACSDALRGLTELFKALSLMQGKGEINDTKKKQRNTGKAEAKNKNGTGKDIIT